MTTATRSANGAITCVVADDHPAVLDSLARVLEEAGYDVVGQVRDGETAANEISTHEPTVAILDMRIPGLDGIAIARRVRDKTGVIIYTGFSDSSLLLEALDVGVRGFVLKEAPLDDLLRAIETVARGGVYIDPVLGGALAGASGTEPLTMLSPREREVLRLLADGCRNDEIGRRLSISSETARAHVRNAMRKLKADTRTQAVALAMRHSMID